MFKARQRKNYKHTDNQEAEAVSNYLTLGFLIWSIFQSERISLGHLLTFLQAGLQPVDTGIKDTSGPEVKDSYEQTQMAPNSVWL